MCGALVAAASSLVAAHFMKGRAGGFGDLAALVLGLTLGYLGGVGLGVVLARRVLRQDGSTAGGMVGAVLGALFVLLTAEPLRLNAESGVLLVTYALCVAVFAAVGFCVLDVALDLAPGEDGVAVGETQRSSVPDIPVAIFAVGGRRERNRHLVIVAGRTLAEVQFDPAR